MRHFLRFHARARGSNRSLQDFNDVFLTDKVIKD
jgi:hypothetical protein